MSAPRSTVPGPSSTSVILTSQTLELDPRLSLSCTSAASTPALDGKSEALPQVGETEDHTYATRLWDMNGRIFPHNEAVTRMWISRSEEHSQSATRKEETYE